MTNLITQHGPYHGHEVSAVLQAAAAATADGEALNTVGCTLALLQVVGAAFTGTVYFEGTQDGVSWGSVRAFSLEDGAAAITTTEDGLFAVPCAGLVQVRARINVGSGSVTVTGIGTTGALPAVGAVVQGVDGVGIDRVLDNVDGAIGAPNALAVWAGNQFYNETEWDRARGNVSREIWPSAARTATPTKADQINYNARGVVVVIDVTAAADTPSIVVTIQGLDPVSGQYYTLLASAAITGISTVVLRVYPGLTAAANLVANGILPRNWAIDVVHADGDSITYSVSADLIV